MKAFLAAIALLAAGAAWTPAPLEMETVDDMPARVVDAPRWTASIEDAPLPRALVAFTEQSRGDGGVTLVGPDDQYRRYRASRGRRTVARCSTATAR